MPIPSITSPIAYGSFTWSELPIPLQIVSADCTNEKVIVELLDGATSLSTLSYPNNTTINIDLQPIARSLPQPNRPVLKNISGAFIDTPQNQNGVFSLKIYYRLSSWPAGGYIINKKILKGGWHNLEQSEWAKPNNYTSFNVNDFFANKGDKARILSYIPNERTIDASEHGWISYVQEIGAIAYERIQYVVKYMDGTWGFFNKDFPSGVSLDKTTWHIPVGIKQLNLDPTNKGVVSTDIIIAGGVDGDIILAAYKIKYDYSPCYTWMDIHYRNSLGGWDFQRFKGAIEFSSDAERKEYDLKPANSKGANNIYDSNLRLRWKANTGYIRQQDMIALNDLLNSQDACLFFEGKLMPLKVSTKSFKWNDSNNGLWNEAFEFESAGKFTVLPLQLMQFFAKYPENR